MTIYPDRPETWKSVPGFGFYEASDKGGIRSVDRTIGGRNLRGVVLRPRVSNKGYLLVNLTDDDGVKRTRTVHTLVLETFAGPCPPGQEACHEHDDPLCNWWPEELHWGTHPQNVTERMRNRPAAPRPPVPERYCIRCQHQVVHGGGRRCHDCVVDIGHQAAAMLAEGRSLAEICQALEYPSEEGAAKLAVEYGGYVPSPPPAHPRPLQRVTARLVTLRARLRDRLRGGHRA
jgi:hypothetical protein